MPYKFNPFTGTFDDSTAGPQGPAGVVAAANSGTALLPGIAFATDPNTGIYNPGADQLAVATNGVGRLFDSSGRLLVGTSSSSGQNATLQVVSSECAQFHKGSADTAPATLNFSKSRNTSYGSFTIVQAEDRLGSIAFRGDDGTDYATRAAEIKAEVDGTPGANDMPGRLVFSVTAAGDASPTERLRITSAGVLQVADAGNITVGTTTGTKIGTATTQKLGFWDKTPVVQPL
jgi:hypothetical protein